MESKTPRRVVVERRRALLDELRTAARDGSALPGDPVPTMRELRERHQLSSDGVTQCLRILADEGVLVTVPRVGTFYASAQGTGEIHLLIMEDSPENYAPRPAIRQRIQAGFEERSAELGSATLVVSMAQMADPDFHRGLPPVAGIFAWSTSTDPSPGWLPDGPAAQVRLSRDPVRSGPDTGPVDRVFLDDVDGGRMATTYLARQGHEVIAFLGLHADRPAPTLVWSSRRADGWAQALTRFGRTPDTALCFTATEQPHNFADESTIARSVARRFVADLPRSAATAVVCANDEVVLSLLDVLDEQGVPQAWWPAVVGFDSGRDLSSRFVTTIRAPWEELGRAAAQLLWERHTGRLTGPAVARTVDMTTIPRMSSQRAWMTWASVAELARAEVSTNP
ncbi:substrate-binding domain-containing protein [Propionibacteriaceae bacterium Y2011]|uniref:substrate-binding domain-containing protein n=1 Tax=Microlunatus sp. Y2014 TaxID=3418488 RepID=UPI003B49BE36